MVLRKIVDLVNDKERFKKLTKTMKIQGEFIYVDYSKTHVNSDFLENKVADIGNLLKKKQEMFKRENVNFTENKSVLNTHCRDKNIIVKLLEEDKQCDLINEDDISICFTLRQMKTFCRDFIDGKLTGATGKVLRTIVNIGIGGSDLGPRMVTAALEFYKKGNSSVHFISNIDPTEFNQVFEKIKVEETLFVVVSKSFTTAETLHNAKLAREKICKKLSISDNDASKHFVAATANSSEAEKFGVYRVFKILEEVNGRFSLWTACGLSIALYIGIENFLDLLLGASLMDQHFYSAEPKENIPIIHALVEDYYNNGDEIENYDNICILPYDVYLKLLPAYLQQAEMESNGKVATETGKTTGNTGMIVWGGIGTDCQHSFFQLIHQSARKIMCEFLLPLSTLTPQYNAQYRELMFNCLAQSRALMIGEPSNDLNKHFEGNKPSITIAYSKLTPAILGALISLYENKIIAQGFLWGINSFDQFGVSLGKKIAVEISNNFENSETFDLSTQGLLHLFSNNRHNK